jgi:flagellar biosynthetic protein FliR
MSLVQELTAMSLVRMVVFVLALARVSGLFMMAPILGAVSVPVRVRAAVVFFIAIALLPVLPADAAIGLKSNVDAVNLAGHLVLETGIGFAIGLVSQFVFSGVLLAGQLSGMQMGMGMANLVDPQSNEQTTPIAQWQNLMALLVFLSIDGHHQLIRAVAESFRLVPMGSVFNASQGLGLALTLASSIFVIALKVASPVIVLLLLVNAAMGVLSKLIPQLNVFVVGFPLMVGAGFFALAASQPFTIQLIENSFSETTVVVAKLLRSLH